MEIAPHRALEYVNILYVKTKCWYSNYNCCQIPCHWCDFMMPHSMFLRWPLSRRNPFALTARNSLETSKISSPQLKLRQASIQILQCTSVACHWSPLSKQRMYSLQFLLTDSLVIILQKEIEQMIDDELCSNLGAFEDEVSLKLLPRELHILLILSKQCQCVIC